MTTMPRGYARQRREQYLSGRLTTKVLAQFFSKVQRDRITGCWNWTASRGGGKKAYSQFLNGTAHHIAYVWFVGAVPAGQHVDHLCRNTLCVNPAHLEAVTPLENRRRADAVRTHCKQGHPRDLYWVMPKRDRKDGRNYGKCLLCGRKWSLNYSQRIRQEASHAASA